MVLLLQLFHVRFFQAPAESAVCGLRVGGPQAGKTETCLFVSQAFQPVSYISAASVLSQLLSDAD